MVQIDGRIAATLATVNLRDFEALGALCPMPGHPPLVPWAVVRSSRRLTLRVGRDISRRAGPEGFVLHGASSLTQISRDPVDIVGQTINENHQYPDGFVLFLGTMFAPIQDRAAKGQGFTHVEGDLVTVATPKLGRLTNRMRHSGDCEPWKFGLTELFAALMRRKGVGRSSNSRRKGGNLCASRQEISQDRPPIQEAKAGSEGETPIRNRSPKPGCAALSRWTAMPSEEGIRAATGESNCPGNPCRRCGRGPRRSALRRRRTVSDGRNNKGGASTAEIARDG